MEKYKFVQNKECEYFPCHSGIVKEAFNCLFCYCPLYALKDQCGGEYTYLENGIKSCERCTKPHGYNGYEHIISRISKITDLASMRYNS